jgi:phenylacetate-CoA ligase
MAFILHAKRIAERIPPGIGQPLSLIPFSARLGPEYARSRAEILRWEQGGGKNDRALLERLSDLVCFARQRVPFYGDIYARNGFSLGRIRDWAEWASIPIVGKADMQGVPLPARSARGRKGLSANTGGTSGQPLDFMLDSRAFAREWAHMHFLWEAHGYRRWHLKLTFRGKHFDRAKVIAYNAVHNELVVNANSPMREVVAAVMAASQASAIRWLHGYPSLISEFALACEEVAPRELPRFRARLFGALLGSEYPAPSYRSAIERVLTTNVVSWYGHSEMAVLARETARDVYVSFPTYGYAEAVEMQDGSHHLVCTSLHNRTHPFIRYDTGDVIEPISLSGGALSFRVSQGRVGDFIVDKQGNRHSLTAVIFGRHHPAFALLRHVQVRDEGNGRMTLVVTPLDSGVNGERLLQGFDLSDLDIDWQIQVIQEPVRTATGKIRLKLPPSL